MCHVQDIVSDQRGISDSQIFVGKRSASVARPHEERIELGNSPTIHTSMRVRCLGIILTLASAAAAYAPVLSRVGRPRVIMMSSGEDEVRRASAAENNASAAVGLALQLVELESARLRRRRRASARVALVPSARGLAHQQRQQRLAASMLGLRVALWLRQPFWACQPACRRRHRRSSSIELVAWTKRSTRRWQR
jgi:hypothetical protein